ncbi:anti-sigma F factor [Epulopiscium sp. SCG-B10WGA-EpuloA2]|nr:anti-sigma F factor [Epulopiscium sp. SCG-B10WGA-EpuloA2]
MDIKFKSLSINTAFARASIGAFLSLIDPTVEELYDIKMAVSEAVSNAIMHGYNESTNETIFLRCSYTEENTCYKVEIEVKDFGGGITDINKARQSLFTTSTDEERAGLGFTVMESVMERVDVSSEKGLGTTITLHTTVKK